MYYKNISSPQTHTHTLPLNSPPAHCRKVVECFPNESIILETCWRYRAQWHELFLARSFFPHQDWAFDPHPIKATMGLSHVLLSGIWLSTNQRISITEDLLSSTQKPNRAFTVLSHQFVVHVEFVWLVWKRFFWLGSSWNGWSGVQWTMVCSCYDQSILNHGSELLLMT